MNIKFYTCLFLLFTLLFLIFDEWNFNDKHKN